MDNEDKLKKVGSLKKLEEESSISDLSSSENPRSQQEAVKKAEITNKLLNTQKFSLVTEIFLKIILFIGAVVFLAVSYCSQKELLDVFQESLKNEVNHIQYYWKILSVVTVSFTVVFTALIIGVFRVKKSQHPTQDMIHNLHE